MEKIIDSFNIYTCSDRGEENPSSTGDVFELNMNNSKIDIQKGQFFVSTWPSVAQEHFWPRLGQDGPQRAYPRDSSP